MIDSMAVVHMNLGRHDEAEQLYLEVLQTRRRILGDRHPGTAGTLYNLACLQALSGDREQALSWLRQSVDAGLAQGDWMAQDTDLELLHGTPEFEQLVEAARQNAIARRAATTAE